MTGASGSLGDVVLADPDGRPVRLSDLAGPLLVVQLMRYYGCLPCQEWLVALDGAAGELEEGGARAVAVGGSADYQARWLRDHRSVQVPLLLDPHQQVRSLVDIGDLGRRLLDPRGFLSYGASLFHGFRPHLPTRDSVRAPGVVILDAKLAVRWRHVGRRVGDYPPLALVFDTLRKIRESDI